MDGAAQDTDAATLSIPFRYAGLGVGSGIVEGTVVLPDDAAAAFVSRAIVEALQEMQHSLIEPKRELGEPVPQDEPWWTDTVPIEQAAIQAHNEAFSGMILPTRFYEIQYVGAYRLERRELLFFLSANLFERAAATEPRRYEADYSGDFFVAPLAEAIRGKLLALSAAESP